jgi:serine/threonine-protein kinase
MIVQPHALVKDVRGTSRRVVPRTARSIALNKAGAPRNVGRMHAGLQIAHFEILSPLGRGGMGEVWRARDTKLRRDVALKTLPPEFAADADRVARLEREATLLASLNHPRIAAIYGLEDTPLGRFMVLELVEGETLADRLQRGPMPIDVALDVAVQIAEALEAAHDKGVIHRDLKPANIKVDADGAVKVLDFGLAKDLVGQPGEPTQTALNTVHGAVMGTPAYMSPEQARGETTTRQTDIWSFGVVLFEMLAGSSPFQADTTAETLANVLRAAPNYSLLPIGTPARVLRLLRRCLQNARRERLQAIGDARLEIQDVRDDAEPEIARRPRALRRWSIAALAGLSLVALGALTSRVLSGRAGHGSAATVRLSIPRLDVPVAQPYGLRHVAISDDGSTIAYAAESGLRVRRLGEAQAILVPEAAQDPFFSPDGRWIGFFQGGLRKVSSRGGASQVLVPDITARPTGGVWMRDGTIVFATTAGLYRVAETGGQAELLATPDRERNERLLAWPETLDGGDALLLTVITADAQNPAHIATLDLRTKALRYVFTGGGSARYLPSGHLIFASSGVLHAVAFDPRSSETRGDPVTLPGTEIGTSGDFASAEFAISATGTLVSLAPRQEGGRTLVWVDRQGNEEPVALPSGTYTYPRISPDGSQIALDWKPDTNRDIWTWDLRRRTLTRVTDDPGEDMLPTWSVDGRRIFFASSRTGQFQIYSAAADGASDARLELEAPKFEAPNSFTPDGQTLITFKDFRELDVVDLADRQFRTLLRGNGVTSLGAVSPDGRWLAYESWEAQTEIDLRPFPDVASRREKVSPAGGRFPVWARNGRNELYYLDLDGHMMSVAVELSPELRLGAVTRLFDWDKPAPTISGRTYDVSPTDGRFLMMKAIAAPSDTSVDLAVTLNWLAEVERLVPVH